MSLADGQTVKNLTMSLSTTTGNGAIYLDWLPDKSDIAYIDFQNKTSNVWVQPLNDKKPAY